LDRASGLSRGGLRIRLKPWLFLILLATVISLALLVLERARYRFVRSDAEMVAMLPHRGLTVFFVNIDLLRKGGLLTLLRSAKPSEESDYREFVHDTRFDYSNDIDVIAGEGDGEQFFFYVRGRFDWSRLHSYATHHGGDCGREFCKVPASTPGRWASFELVQPNVIALAVGRDPGAVQALQPQRIEKPPALPPEPVWVRVEPSLLSNPKGVPLPAQVLAMALESTDQVMFFAGADRSRPGQFQITMEANCRNRAIADTTRRQLEIQTKMLGLELAREHQRPNPADLTGLLTAGGFQVIDKTVVGTWPLRRELLEKLK
jgi:hypothetical protein